jgi:hypothetical protein
MLSPHRGSFLIKKPLTNGTIIDRAADCERIGAPKPCWEAIVELAVRFA